MTSIAHVSDRLYKLSNSTRIPWSAEFKNDFKVLNQRLLQRPIVRVPNHKRDFTLETDASLVAVEAMLMQAFGDTNLEHSVAFFSRALTTTEQYYSVYELKITAVLGKVELFWVHMFGR